MGGMVNELSYTGIKSMHYIFLIFGIIFVVAFLFMRRKACYQQYGTKSLSTDFKGNTRKYVSALLAFGVILQLPSFIDTCKRYFRFRFPEAMSSFISATLSIVASVLLAYAVLSLGRRRMIASVAFVLKGISVIFWTLFELIKYSNFIFDWLTMLDFVVYIALAVLLLRGVTPKITKLVLLVYLAITIVMVFVTCFRGYNGISFINMLFYYFIPTAIPTVAFNLATFLIF